MNELETDGADGAVGRVIGRLAADEPGPTLICIGGVHGNEPAGYRGLRRVMDSMGESPHLERGDFLALAGNIRAMAEGVRYIDRDLNRHWRSHQFLPGHEPTGKEAEDIEQAELIAEIKAAIDRARGDVFLLDLHTTSGQSRPFLVIADSLNSRSFAKAFPNPIILGLEEHLDGTLIDCTTNLGFAGVAFEAGQNEGIDSVANVEAAVWIALQFAGIIGASHTKEVDFARAQLKHSAADLPRLAEVRYRHEVMDSEKFVIEPGLHGFKLVDAGQVIAQGKNGAVTTPEAGYLLMPRYQAQGNDGFFVVRRVLPFWLSVSAALRWLQVYRLVHLLPGIARDPDNELGVVVHTNVAKWLALELLHLLGFKRVRASGSLLWMSRRESLLNPKNRAA